VWSSGRLQARGGDVWKCSRGIFTGSSRGLQRSLQGVSRRIFRGLQGVFRGIFMGSSGVASEESSGVFRGSSGDLQGGFRGGDAFWEVIRGVIIGVSEGARIHIFDIFAIDTFFEKNKKRKNQIVKEVNDRLFSKIGRMERLAVSGAPEGRRRTTRRLLLLDRASSASTTIGVNIG
jgi:hypothetical protein